MSQFFRKLGGFISRLLGVSAKNMESRDIFTLESRDRNSRGMPGGLIRDIEIMDGVESKSQVSVPGSLADPNPPSAIPSGTELD